MSASERLIDEMGLMFQESGAPRIAGRIFGLIMVDGGKLSLQQISERLGASKSSVSTNTRMLARQGILKLAAHPGDRQDYYELASFAYPDMIRDVSARFRHSADRLEACAIPLRAENPQAADRLDGLTDFYRKSAEILENWGDTLRLPGKDSK